MLLVLEDCPVESCRGGLDGSHRIVIVDSFVLFYLGKHDAENRKLNVLELEDRTTNSLKFANANMNRLTKLSWVGF